LIACTSLVLRINLLTSDFIRLGNSSVATSMAISSIRKDEAFAFRAVAREPMDSVALRFLDRAEATVGKTAWAKRE
jgi:hypothetical protein